MVMATSSGSPQPNSRLRSRIGTSPWQIRLPSSRRMTPRLMASCSSSMSPVISSMMSSSVTMPRSAPYSSTTMAKCSWRARKAWSWSNSTVDSGMNQGGVMTSSILTARGPPGGLDGAEQVLGVDHADDVVGLAAIERDARVGRRQHLGDDRRPSAASASISDDVAAMGHDVADRAVAEVEHRAQHRLLGRRGLVGLALAVQFDGAAQHVGLLVDIRRAVDCTPISRRKSATIQATAARHRSQDRQVDHDRRRQDQRHAVGAQQRPGLGHHLGEDHHQDADDDRGVDDAGRAERSRSAPPW